tara:strand:+ start:439 stop:1179 length:741 start_codon:yes stop_codon:yes gene_type:complete
MKEYTLNKKKCFIKDGKIFKKYGSLKLDPIIWSDEIVNSIPLVLQSFNKYDFLPNTIVKNNEIYIETFINYEKVKFTDLINDKNKLSYLFNQILKTDKKKYNFFNPNNLFYKIVNSINIINNDKVIKSYTDGINSDTFKKLNNIIEKEFNIKIKILFDNFSIFSISDIDLNNIYILKKNKKIIDFKIIPYINQHKFGFTNCNLIVDSNDYKYSDIFKFIYNSDLKNNILENYKIVKINNCNIFFKK